MNTGGEAMTSFRFVAAGDAIITRRCAQKTDPSFLQMIDLIRDSDAAFVNLEVVTPRPPLVPSAEHGGSNLGAQEYVLDELKWMGFNLFNVATNHSNDYTFHGLLNTMDALRERGMVFAGGGHNLGEARSPAYFDTAEARVGLLGAASSFVVGAPAGPSREDMPGRPGISPLRVDYEYVLDRERFAALADLDEALGTAQVGREHRALARVTMPDGIIDFLGHRFVLGQQTGIRERVNQRDLEDICRWIHDAKRQSEFVVMSLHAHQGQGRRGNSPDLADFLPDVAHRFIEAGADVVVGHGPHMLRAIEVYQGKPIFYSLGDFYYVSSGIHRYPAEIYQRLGLPETATPADVQDINNYDAEGNPRNFAADERFWQSVIPVCEYEDWKLVSLALHPIELNFRARHRSLRGEPRLADVETGTSILQQLQQLSEPFGLKISIEPSGAGHVVGRVSW
jgi:poly-gamma-glutamate synthesis protein (capsule biosynthesis protein)